MPGFRPNSLEVAQTIRRDYPPFISAVARNLRLNKSQQESLRDVDYSIWLPWAVSILGGDEMVIGIHSNQKLISNLPEESKKLLGQEHRIEDQTFFDFRSGELALRVNELYKKNDYGSRDKLEKLSQSSANFMGTLGALIGVNSEFWTSAVPEAPQTILKPDGDKTVIKFLTEGTEAFPVEGKTDTVVTFGPGLSASQFIGASLGRIEEAHLVSGGLGAAFINNFAKRQLDIMSHGIENMRRRGELKQQAPKGVDPDSIKLPETFFYDEGIARSIGSIASRAEEVDVVVMSSVHSAGEAECQVGVEGAHRLLREGGILAIKAPRISIGNEGGMDIVATKAIRFFGSPKAAGECGTLARQTDSSLPAERPADFAIFQKSYR